MPQKKISALTAAGPKTGAEIIPLVQSGATVRETHANFVGDIAPAISIAASGTMDLGASTGMYINITGTTTITALGTARNGVVRWCKFAASLIITHNATSLILPGGSNIQTSAGDVALFVSEGSGNWRCLSYESAGERGAWTDYTPTVSASTPAGSGFAYTVTHARYRKTGRTVRVSGLVTLTNLGSGPAASGVLSVSLPFSSLNAAVGSGTEQAVLSHQCQAYVTAGSSSLTLKRYDGSSLVVLNYAVRFEIEYETAA